MQLINLMHLQREQWSNLTESNKTESMSIQN